MKTNLHKLNTQLIAYVKGELNTEEIKALDEILMKDERTFQTFLFIEELHSKGELDSFLERLNGKFHKRLNQTYAELYPSPKKQLISKRYIAIAATILIVIVSSTVLYNTWNVKPLYEANFKPYLVVSASRGTSNENINFIERAKITYQKQQYDSTIYYYKRFKQTQAALTERDKLIWANAYMVLEQYQPASVLLKQIISDRNSMQVYFHACWYEALIAIKSKQYTKATELLKVLNDSPTYKKKANHLLKEIAKR